MRLTQSGQLLYNTTNGPTAAWNSNSFVNLQTGIQITHTGNANYWRQASWSGDPADFALYFPGGTTLGSVANVASLNPAGAWTNASDARHKTNIRDIEHGLDTVLRAKPRSFNRINLPKDYVGFVAQELKEVVPEVVEGSDESYYGVDYGSLVAVAFKAIQEQQAIIESLTARVAQLEGK